MILESVEMPIRRRDYEEGWRFGAGVCRFCVALEDGEDLPLFARCLEVFWGPDEKLLMECYTVYSGEKHFETAAGKPLLKLSTSELRELSTDAMSCLLQDFVIAFHRGTYSCVVPGDSVFSDIVEYIEPEEWWGSIWDGGEPYSLCLDSDRQEWNGRFEEFMLRSIGTCTCVFFLSPNHRHLEIMCLSEMAEGAVESLREKCR